MSTGRTVVVTVQCESDYSMALGLHRCLVRSEYASEDFSVVRDIKWGQETQRAHGKADHRGCPRRAILAIAVEEVGQM